MKFSAITQMIAMRCDRPYLDPVKFISHPQAKWYQVPTRLLSDPAVDYDWQRFAPLEVHLIGKSKCAVAHNAHEFREFLPMFSERSNVPYSVGMRAERMEKRKPKGATRQGKSFVETFAQDAQP